MTEDRSRKSQEPTVEASVPTLDPVREDRAMSNVLANLFGTKPDVRLAERYELRDRIAAGGMGVVYQAWDPQLERLVAVKLLRLSGQSADALATSRARMIREAKAMARVSSPHVVNVFDAGQLEDTGDVFIVMELLSGGTLGDWLSEPRTQAAIVDAFAQAARGLHAAHEAGVVHRDFKPSNAIMADDGRVRVLDFGLARPIPEDAVELGSSNDGKRGLDADALQRLAEAVTVVQGSEPSWSNVSTITGRHAFVGTPRYMAPELFADGKPSPATDIYAWCVSLYRALYERVPHDGDDLVSLYTAKAEGTVDFSGPQALPSPVMDLLRRGLSARPSDRPQSMAEVFAAVEPGRRSRALLFGGIVVAALGGLGLVVVGGDTPGGCDDPDAHREAMWSEARRGQVQEKLTGQLASSPVADLALTQLDALAEEWGEHYAQACAAVEAEGEESKAADRTMSCLSRNRRRFEATVEVVIGDADVAPARAAQAVMSLPGADACRLETELAGPVLRPSNAQDAREVERLRAQIERTRALLLTGDRDGAVEVADEALAAATEVAFDPVVAEAGLMRGRVAAMFERLDDAAQRYEQAYFGAVAVGHDRLALEAAGALTSLHLLQIRDLEQAQAWYRRAEGLVQAAGSPPEARARLLSRSVILGVYAGDYDATRGASEGLRVALEHSRALPISERFELQNWSAWGLMSVGDAEAAVALLEPLTTDAVKRLGPQHTIVLQMTGTLANALAAVGDLDGAIERDTALVEAYETLQGRRSANLSRMLSNRGLRQIRRGDFDAAERDLVRAIDIARESAGEGSEPFHIARSNLAALYLRTERWADALEIQTRIVAELDESTSVPKPVDIAREKNNLGRLLLEVDRPGDALTHLEQAVEVAGTADIPPKMVMSLYRLLTAARWRTGDHDGAREAVRAGVEVRAAVGDPTGLSDPDAWLDEVQSGERDPSRQSRRGGGAAEPLPEKRKVDSAVGVDLGDVAVEDPGDG